MLYLNYKKLIAIYTFPEKKQIFSSFFYFFPYFLRRPIQTTLMPTDPILWNRIGQMGKKDYFWANKVCSSKI